MQETRSLFDLLDSVVWSFIDVRKRYPLLLRTSVELDSVRPRFQAEAYNEGLMQILRDSFDMLVIDLYSIRESLVEDGGLFDRIREDPMVLSRRTAEEFKADPVLVFGTTAAGQKEIVEEETTRSKNRIASDINSAIERRFSSAVPVTPEDVSNTICVFRKLTKPLDDDRNRVRAHRYQRSAKDTSHLFIALPDLAKQIDVMEAWLADLYLALRGGKIHLESSFAFAGSTPEDLVDILVHGSINHATLVYGLAPSDPNYNEDLPWYWAKRAAALKK